VATSKLISIDIFLYSYKTNIDNSILPRNYGVADFRDNQDYGIMESRLGA
jgi:hypothetical protein